MRSMDSSRAGRDGNFIIMDDLRLEVVDSFKFLDFINSAYSGLTEEIMAMIGAALKYNCSLDTILRSKLLPRSAKLQVYTAIIRPIATHTRET